MSCPFKRFRLSGQQANTKKPSGEGADTGSSQQPASACPFTGSFAPPPATTGRDAASAQANTITTALPGASTPHLSTSASSSETASTALGTLLTQQHSSTARSSMPRHEYSTEAASSPKTAARGRRAAAAAFGDESGEWGGVPTGSSRERNGSPVSNGAQADSEPVSSSSCPLGYSASAAPSAAACPFGFTSLPAVPVGPLPPRPGPGAAVAEPAAVCPYGYSAASAGPALTPFQCSLCRTFLHACAALQPCGHKFCRFCVAPFRDCPVCGADVKELRDDPELQGQVDRFLEAHCRSAARSSITGSMEGPSPTQTPAAAVAVLAVSQSGSGSGRADFFLRLGTQALVGGNAHAAYDRLELCRSELVMKQQDVAAGINTRKDEEQEEAPGGATSSAPSHAHQQQEQHDQQQQQQQMSLPEARLACQLGAVLGLQADCCRRVGDATRAERLYAQSAEVLAPHASDDTEVAHSLSVTSNKLGDLRYYAQDHAGASSAYRQALALRRSLLASAVAATEGAATSESAATPGTSASATTPAMATALQRAKPGEKAYSAALDVVTSLIKVADAELAAVPPVSLEAADAEAGATDTKAGSGAGTRTGTCEGTGTATTVSADTCLAEASEMLTALSPVQQDPGQTLKAVAADLARRASLLRALEACRALGV